MNWIHLKQTTFSFYIYKNMHNMDIISVSKCWFQFWYNKKMIFYLFMHQIKRDSEPHLGSGKCILKNLIRKEILMYYRHSLYLRHFQNDKSQRPFSPSFFLPILPPPSPSHEPWLSIVRDYRSIAGPWPVEDLLLIFICIWNKPILSCQCEAEPCGPIVYI